MFFNHQNVFFVIFCINKCYACLDICLILYLNESDIYLERSFITVETYLRFKTKFVMFVLIIISYMFENMFKKIFKREKSLFKVCIHIS